MHRAAAWMEHGHGEGRRQGQQPKLTVKLPSCVQLSGGSVVRNADTPEEVAAAVLWLVGAGAAYVIGAVVPVGGR